MVPMAEVGVAEAARRLGVGLTHVYGLIWAGKLQGKKSGGTWLVPIAAIEERLRLRQSSLDREVTR